MSFRLMPPPPAPSPAGSDLDTTAELPVLDAATGAPADTAATAEHQTRPSSDSWRRPPEARAAPPAGPDAADAADAAHNDAHLQLSARLREAQELLTSKGDRLTQLERARDDAQAARAAADERIAALSAQLAEHHARAAALSGQLAEQQTRAAHHATQLEESQRRRSAAEQRVAQLGAELAQARALVSAAAAREAQLQRRLDDQERASREQFAQELQQRDALAAQERVHTAGVMGDLHLERARAVTYLESLQSIEARRLIGEELVTDLQLEAEARATELARLASEFAGRDGEARERDAELAQRAARIAQLEQQVSSFAEALSQRDVQLREARQESQGLQLGFTRLQSELTAGGERVRALESQVERHTAADARAQGELQRLQAERAPLNAALESARAAAAAHATQAAAQDAAVVSGRERLAQAEAALAAERQRTGQLASELERVRGEMEDWGSALQNMQQEREGHLAAIAAAEARAQDLEQSADGQGEELRALHARCDAYAARERELEADRRAAEDSVHRLESEVRSRNARLEELERSNQQWRSVEEVRHVSTDTAANPVLRDAARHVAEADAPLCEAAPVSDGMVRLLIQSEGGSEIVHVLSRKTSIGRTPDNDVQIDAKFVSRHHAVILAGPAQTIIEDLNSTNGVQINGRRITRHPLKDGDQVAFGRTLYRFAVRKANDKR